MRGRLLLWTWPKVRRIRAKEASPLTKARAYRWVRRVFRLAGWTLVALVLLLALAAGALVLPPVQTWLAEKLGDRLHRELGVEVRIASVAIRPWGPIALKGIRIHDLQGDTLISAGELRVLGLGVHPRQRLLSMSTLELRDTRFALAKPEGDSISNLTRILDLLAGDEAAEEGKPWRITCRRVMLDGLHFSFHDHNSTADPFGVDLDHVDVRKASILAHGLDIDGDTIRADLRHITFMERSGLHLEGLSGQATVASGMVRLDHMRLVTPFSRLEGDLQMKGDGFIAFNDFSTQVEMRLTLDSSHLDMADIAWFAHDLEGIRLPLDIRGRFRGTVSDLKGRDVDVRFGQRSHFLGHGEMIGLPDFENTFMVFDVDRSHLDPTDLARLPVPPFTQGRSMALPDEMQRTGPIRFSGNFTGFPASFTAFGTTVTDLGTLRTDMSYGRQDDGTFTLSGRVATDRFHLGRLVDVTTIGEVATNIRLLASGPDLKNLSGELEGTFPLLTVNDYPISGITVNGTAERNLFNGELACRDPNLNMDFKGLADMRGTWPEVDFSALVQHADLAALNIIDTNAWNTLSMLVTAKGRLSPDSLAGRVELRDIWYCVEDDEHHLGDISVESLRDAGENLLQLRSDMADMDIRGTFLPTRLPVLLRSVLFSVFPALRDEVEFTHAEQRFNFDLWSKDTAPLWGMVLPRMHLAPGAHFSGGLDSRSFGIWLTADMPSVGYGGLRSDSVRLTLDKTLEVLAFSVQGERQMLNDSTFISGVAITGKAYQDDLDISMGWEGSSRGTSGDLNILGEVRGARALSLALMPSRLFFGRGNWTNTEVAHIRMDSTAIRVDSLILHNDGQHIVVDGLISHDPEAALAFEMIDVRMENLAPFMGGPTITGSLSGDGRIMDIYKDPYLLSYLCLDTLMIGGRLVGDLRTSAVWNEDDRSIDVNGVLTRGEIKALDFSGTIAPGREEELDLRIVMDRFDLAFIDPYMPEGMSGLQGRVTGSLAADGRLLDPQVHGVLELEEAGLRIDYLNTTYTFSHQVKVEPDMFALDLATVRDEEGNTARLNATVLHDGFSGWNFNVFAEVDRFLCLNTSVHDNALYYGKAYGTGDIEVSGEVGSLQITVDATTAPGTNIRFPLGGSTEISGISFVRFITGDTTVLAQEQVLDLTGIDLNMKVLLTPDARFELIFDPTVGDILSGSGRGTIEMGVTQLGEFTMRGEVLITDGTYLFTLRNVVNKRFELQQGGLITWYGDPFDAQLDLRAVYKLRAPLFDIMFDKNDAYRRRVPVEVVMGLRDKLMNPEIDFAVRLPTVDESVRTQVNSVLSTEQELNRQVFALIVLNKFLPPPTYAGPAGSANVAGTTGSELLSNQVSNWLSRISRDFDLGLNYRPGDNISQDEFELAVSTQLFNERLLLSTNVGVMYGERGGTRPNNAVVGDFQMEYLLTRDGKLRAKAYSQSNDRNLNRADQALTTQGVGLAFREEFNDVEEFWQKVLNLFRPAQRDRRFD